MKYRQIVAYDIYKVREELNIEGNPEHDWWLADQFIEFIGDDTDGNVFHGLITEFAYFDTALNYFDATSVTGSPAEIRELSQGATDSWAASSH